MVLSVIYSCKKEELQIGITVKDYLTGVPIPGCEAGNYHLDGRNFYFKSYGRTDSKGFLKYPKNLVPQLINHPDYFSNSISTDDPDFYQETVRGADVFLLPRDSIYIYVKFPSTSVVGADDRVYMVANARLRSGREWWYVSDPTLVTKSTSPFKWYVPKGLENEIRFRDSGLTVLQSFKFTPSVSSVDTFTVSF
jgi:hypothetical protein